MDKGVLTLIVRRLLITMTLMFCKQRPLARKNNTKFLSSPFRNLVRFNWKLVFFTRCLLPVIALLTSSFTITVTLRLRRRRVVNRKVPPKILAPTLRWMIVRIDKSLIHRRRHKDGDVTYGNKRWVFTSPNLLTILKSPKLLLDARIELRILARFMVATQRRRIGTWE